MTGEIYIFQVKLWTFKKNWIALVDAGTVLAFLFLVYAFSSTSRQTKEEGTLKMIVCFS